MEGTSDCPGDPCETSIPRMMVGTLEITVKAGVRSTLNMELRPPSYREYIHQILYTRSKMNDWYKEKKKDRDHLGVDLQKTVGKILIIRLPHRSHTLSNDAVFS